MPDTAGRADTAASDEHHRRELLKEAATMGLYVAICLLAALAVASHGDVTRDGTMLKIIWGTTLGLTLAHWFAFRVSSRLVASGVFRRSDAELAGAQFLGSVVVAALTTVPVLLVDGEVEFRLVSWVLVGFIALVAWFVARNAGATLVRSLTYTATTTVIAVAIVIVKNALSGH